MKKTFNIIICGVGGQGIITLLKIVANAALAEGFDVKSSELHGLSQREGSVKAHIKIGKDISSPLIIPGETNLILGLEAQEALRAKNLAGPKTIFVVNNYVIPIQESKLNQEKIKNYLKKEINPNNLYLIDATWIVKRELNNPVVAGIFLLGYASAKKILSLSKKSLIEGMKKAIEPQYLNINQKTLELAKKLSPQL